MVLSALAIAGIAGLTLRPGQTLGPAQPLVVWCVWCGDTGTTNLILNTVLFAPLGAGLALLGLRRKAALTAGLGLSLLIEMLQLTVLEGRYGALGDVLANTLGVWLGHRVTNAGMNHGRLLSRRGYLARSLLAWGFAISIPALVAMAFQPAPGPGQRAWFGQWANVLANLDPFGGEVLEVRLNGLPVPRGRLPQAERLRQAWREDPLRFEAKIRTGPIPARRALVATIAEDLVGWPAAIWQDGADAILSLRLAAADLGVGSPQVRLLAAFAQPAGTELRLSIEDSAGVLTARAEGGGRDRVARVPLKVSAAWITMWPWSKALGGETPLRTTAWLIGFAGVTAGLLGFWTTRAHAAKMGAGLAATVPLITHAAIPAWGGLPGGTFAEWAATTVATAAGFVLGLLLAGPKARADR